MNLRNLVAYNALQKQHTVTNQPHQPHQPPPSHAQSIAPKSRKRPPPAPASGGAAASAPRHTVPGKIASPPAFFCAPCSKGFKTQAMFDMHVEDHEECSHPGCKFSACSGVMKEHRLIHTPRVQKWMNMTPEEIQQWREERRRNFPTEENVKRKKEEAERRKAEEEQLRKRRKTDEKQEERKPPMARKQNVVQDKKAKPPRPSLLRSLFSAERFSQKKKRLLFLLSLISI
jgi:hypothetical protein